MLTVHLASNVQRCSTDAGRTTSGLQPIPLHALHQLQGCVSHLGHLLAEMQPRGKSMQVQGGVHGPASEDQTNQSEIYA